VRIKVIWVSQMTETQGEQGGLSGSGGGNDESGGEEKKLPPSRETRASNRDGYWIKELGGAGTSGKWNRAATQIASSSGSLVNRKKIRGRTVAMDWGGANIHSK